MKRHHSANFLLTIVFGCFIVTWTAGPPPSHADDKTSNLNPKQTKAEAKAAFMKGVELFSSEDYAGALSAFENSYEIRPKKSVLYNIAMCQKALFRYIESIITFRSYLKSGKAKPARLNEVKSAISEMEGLIGALRLLDAPDGAKIEIDGESLGVTPLEDAVMLNPGQHTVKISAKGFRQLQTVITIAAGADANVRAALARSPASVSIQCQATNTVVLIDNKVVGECPYRGEIEPGPHDVEVKAPEMTTYFQKINSVSGEVVELNITLVPATDLPEKGVSAMLVSGIVCTVLGAGGIVVGAYYTYQGSQDFATVEKEVTGDHSKYSEASDALRTDKIAMGVGFGLGGALAVAGITLIMMDQTSEEENENEAVAIRPTLNGIAIDF